MEVTRTTTQLAGSAIETRTGKSAMLASALCHVLSSDTATFGDVRRSTLFTYKAQFIVL
jgi:hypothetical protein